MLTKLSDTATLRLDMLVKEKLEFSPIVVDRDETADCVTK
jgi:hypothetical protein